jgi:hypothetical protein
MREGGTGQTIETRRICAAHFSRPAMKIKIILPGNYLQHNVVCIQNQIFYHSFILEDYISLQPPCQILSVCSCGFDNRFLIPIAITSIVTLSIRRIISLLLFIFTSIRLLSIIMNDDHSNFVTELNEFNRSEIRENRKVNIWICLFIPGSPSRLLSRRVAHHRERSP